MRYQFIESQRTLHCIERMCALLDVSRAGYYEWRSRPRGARATAADKLRAAIVDAHDRSGRRYGRRRIRAELSAKGIPLSEKCVGRLMKSVGIAGLQRHRFRKTTDSNHDLPVAPNVLARRFDPGVIGALNRIWAGDITYLPTREGWLYLAVVLDLSSRRVVGWSMSPSMHRQLVIDALGSAIKARRPQPGLIFHSDRGSQYASDDFRRLLREHRMIQSMSAKGECWDNAVVESFFGSMKGELGDPIWESRAAARAAVFHFIEVWYNRERRHSSLAYVSPDQFEMSLAIAA